MSHQKSGKLLNNQTPLVSNIQMESITNRSEQEDDNSLSPDQLNDFFKDNKDEQTINKLQLND